MKKACDLFPDVPFPISEKGVRTDATFLKEVADLIAVRAGRILTALISSAAFI